MLCECYVEVGRLLFRIGPRSYDHVFHSPSSADLLTSAAAARAALRCKEWRESPLLDRPSVSQNSGVVLPHKFILHYTLEREKLT